MIIASGQPSPGPDVEMLARDAYAAYGVAVGGLNHLGEPMPAWVDLGETIQEAWRRAAAAVADRVRQT